MSMMKAFRLKREKSLGETEPSQCVLYWMSVAGSVTT